MFAISDATGGYGKTTIVRDVCLDVKQGEIVAFLGRNGVGKTTLLKYAMGLIDVFGGSVTLAGRSLPREGGTPCPRRAWLVPQGRFVFPRLIAGILKRLNTDLGLSIVVAEQDLDFCLSLAKRAYVLHKGKIARETTKQDLLADKDLLHELLGV